MTTSNDGGDAEAQVNAARVLAYHTGQHADCVTCRLLRERDAAVGERDRLRKRMTALQAVVDRVPEWRLLSMGGMGPATLHCTICGARYDKGHVDDCPWLRRRETAPSEVSP